VTSNVRFKTSTRIVWHRLYQEKEAALEAVGLSEQDTQAGS
jgi:hypothetical protein